MFLVVVAFVNCPQVTFNSFHSPFVVRFVSGAKV